MKFDGLRQNAFGYLILSNSQDHSDGIKMMYSENKIALKALETINKFNSNFGLYWRPICH